MAKTKPKEKHGLPTKAKPTAGESVPARANGSASEPSSAMLGFEAKLWQAADKPRSNMDASEGSGSMFVSNEKFVEAHGGFIGDVDFDARESNHTTRRLAMMEGLILREYGYQPDKQKAATNRVLQQPELPSCSWIVGSSR